MKENWLRPEALDLLIENRIQNSKEYYEQVKPRIRALVTEPLYELIGELTPTMLEIDPLFVVTPQKMLSRIRRDTRYTKDKTLYRASVWLTFGRAKLAFASRPCYYFEVTPEGFSYGCGYYQAPPADMQLAREMILREDKLFLDAFDALRKNKKFVQYGESYKRPKYPDAPEQYQEWLNKKSIGVSYDSQDFDALFSGKFFAQMQKDFKAIAPLYHFMCTIQERSNAMQEERRTCDM